MRVRIVAVTTLLLSIGLCLAIVSTGRSAAEPATACVGSSDGALHAIGALDATRTFTEEFSSVTFMDAEDTTAHWDTSSGLLKLRPTEPIIAHQLGAHDWLLSCRWYKPWAGCLLPDAPAVYVPETGKAYHLANHIAEYDPRRNLSVDLNYSGPALPCHSAAAAYASVAGTVYVFGGCGVTPWETCLPQEHIYEFDPVARTSTLLPVELPYGLNNAAAAYVPDTNKIYIFGGWTPPNDPRADILEFDVATRSVQVLSTQLPSARSHLCATYVPDTHLNRIYLFGGNTRDAILDEILAFDPSTEELSLLETRLPVGLRMAAAVYVAPVEDVLIFGGEREGWGPSRLVLAFDAESEYVWQAPYLLPGEGLIGAAAIYTPEFDRIAVLGGERRGPWPHRYTGILRLRWDGSSLMQQDSYLPWESHTSSAVYVPEENNAYLFGGGRAEILQFDIQSSLFHTMSATLPLSSTDPGVVWVPAEQLAYVFDRSGIYSYDPASDMLTTMAAELPAGFDPRVVAYAPPRNAVYLFDSADANGAILRYNLAEGTLVTLDARLLPPRRGAYAVYVPDSNLIFIMGGWGYQIDNYLDAIWVFDVATETLTRQQGLLMPIPGVYKASTHLPTTSNIFLLGGWGGWSEVYAFPFAGIWHFDTTPIRHFVEHALTLPRLLGHQAMVWASAEDRFYTFGGLAKKETSLTPYSTDLIYRFDCGHAEQGVAQSTRINSDGSAVLRATLSVIQELDNGKVDYFLSNDAGATWDAVSPGIEHTFAAPGSDLRWKADLHGDGIHTPAVDRVTIRWLEEVPPNHPPEVGTITPSTGSGPAAVTTYFTTTWTDADGWQDLKHGYLHIGASPSISDSVTLLYNASKDKLWIRSDDGSTWLGGFAPGSANTLENSQARVYCVLTTKQGVGDTLQVKWAIEFKPAYTGAKKTGLKCRDLQKAKAKGEWIGTWTID
jgi:hypothetical protein